MSGRPDISIVMSVYNDARHVGRAIDSIRKQTFEDWELIVINDGSTDDSGHILASAAKSDWRIRVNEQENTGLTRSLIRGCAEARGEFIARHDSDDRSMPERLLAQLSLIQSEPEIGFVSCFADYIGPRGELLDTMRRPENPKEATRRLLKEREGPPAHGSVMFRKALYGAVGGYRPEFYFAQDSDLWLRMAERALIGYVPEVLYTPRREIASTSGAMRPVQKRFGELGQLCRAARKEGQSEAPYLAQAAALTEQVRAGAFSGKKIREGEVGATYALASQLATHGDPRARRYLWQVIRTKPWHWKAWVRLAQLTGAPKSPSEP